jgi:large subunit ribosomal protein L21
VKYAVIQTGGKQYTVYEGQTLDVERLPKVAVDEEIIFPNVLLFVDDEKVLVGQPSVANVVVKGKLVANLKGEKVSVRKFKAKVRYRRTKGHRQFISRVSIVSITNKSTQQEVKEEASTSSTRKRRSRKA